MNVFLKEYAFFAVVAAGALGILAMQTVYLS